MESNDIVNIPLISISQPFGNNIPLSHWYQSQYRNIFFSSWYSLLKFLFARKVAQSKICQLSGWCSLHNWLHNNLKPHFIWSDLLIWSLLILSYRIWYDHIHIQLLLMLSYHIPYYLINHWPYSYLVLIFSIILSYLNSSDFCLITSHLILSFLINSHLIPSDPIWYDHHPKTWRQQSS